jgi:rhamnopyranosyl-N-acetylglucosaminyl-diphospho-decaprenol beta-1,3/1,4-galactofuranosyltransferase
MKFGVVLVTYNRLEKLKLALDCYDKQTYSPKYLLVVNNNSNDGTRKYLEKWKKLPSHYEKIVLNLPRNTGGSGGFYEGLKKSLYLDADWVWVADDDAFPMNNDFEIANKYLSSTNIDASQISAICGMILNRGKIDTTHRRRIMNIISFPMQFIINRSEYKKNCFNLQLFSYVGTFINKDKMKQIGITKKDYFIYNDDSEHSYRLSKIGKIICLPDMVINHDGPQVITKDGVNWKLYYSIRNVLDMIKSNWPYRFYFTYRLYVRIKYFLIITFLYKNKIEGYKLMNKAITDADNNKLGLDHLYRPGWKPNKK